MLQLSHFALVGLLVLLPAAQVGGDSKADQARRNREAGVDTLALGARIPALMDSAGIPGLALALIEDRRLVWIRGFGQRTVEGGTPVDASTVFEAASLGKPVFAYLVLKLVESGAIDLDRPLADYLVHSDLTSDPRLARITARTVLSHTSGLPNELHPGDTLRIAFDPGSRFGYSGEGFVYLQQVIERLTGRPLAQLARELVFQPLGMDRSSFVWEKRFEPNAAVGHWDGRIPRVSKRPMVARSASSLHTTVADYALFVLAILKGRGLSEGSLVAMLTPGIIIAPEIAWGLGWALEYSSADTFFWHWGDNSDTGFTAFVIGSREHGRAVVWFANGSSGLSIREPLLSLTMAGSDGAARWIDYERYDDPRRIAREHVDRMVVLEGVHEGLELYQRLKKEVGPEIVGEGVLNSIGYRMLVRGRLDESIALLRANAEQYPGSANAYDSLGEAYLAAGRECEAIENYELSLRLDPRNHNAQRILEALRGRPTAACP